MEMLLVVWFWMDCQKSLVSRPSWRCCVVVVGCRISAAVACKGMHDLAAAECITHWVWQLIARLIYALHTLGKPDTGMRTLDIMCVV
jgi:hypothetical protein